MKTILVLSILLCAIAYPTFSDPTQNSVETDIAVIKNEISSLKESIDTGFANVQKDIDRVYTILICFILGLLTLGANIWGILAYIRSRKEDTLQNQIERLTQEIEKLKQLQC